MLIGSQLLCVDFGQFQLAFGCGQLLHEKAATSEQDRLSLMNQLFPRRREQVSLSKTRLPENQHVHAANEKPPIA
ncbi:MAG: hypothetical protein JWM11_2745 [Planctomycetaceae bacterium]|nr:hypothetical protein [Planctomycetaceae bacterium]